MTKNRNLAGFLPDGNAMQIPSGNTAQRPAGTSGDFRYNTDSNSFEGYSSGAWGSIGGGGGASGGVFYENSNQITASYTSPSGKNMMSTGPIVMNTAGILVTITGNSVWKVI
jgi:hypothetical protein